ncbi:DUF1493 family protein [Mariniradius sediminis]|uniref:DUF1493 family protein n=1 Tax=Mariniradius sediminis TaxID=2909237 RepID=A0ABS9BS56_9BACT|nr:DUF1493 family protein [Mariniradius sediminis]
MEDKELELVVSFLKEELNLKNKIIKKTTSLSDLGLDGDDSLELMVKFFKRFNIEYEGTNFLEFIPKESGFLYATLNSLLGIPSKGSDVEIYVQDLLYSLLKKRWSK